MRGAAFLALALIAAALPAYAELSATAQFAHLTDRYGHGALGPGQEYESLRVTVSRSTVSGAKNGEIEPFAKKLRRGFATIRSERITDIRHGVE